MTEGKVEDLPFIAKAKEIATRYLGQTYTLDPEPSIEFEFVVVESLWTWGEWSVLLWAELDGCFYRVVHNGKTGEVKDVTIPPEPIEKSING